MTTSTAEFDGVLELAAERSAAAEQMGRLDPDVVAALASAGVNRALLPAALGGREAHPRELIDAVARIAAADGSTGWCVSISAGCNLFAGYVSEEAARDMYVDPDVGLAGMFAAMGVVTTTARTGRSVTATLTGRWPFASDCPHSRWIVLGAVVRDEQGTTEPMPRMIVVPTEDLVIENTWHSAGLRATGSHHVRADDVQIDLARSCTFAGRSWADGPLWRMPMSTVLGSVLVAAPLGIARAAIDDSLDVVSAGAGGAMRGLLVNDPVGLAELAAVDAALRAAYAGVVAAVDEVWVDAVAGRRATRPGPGACGAGYASRHRHRSRGGLDRSSSLRRERRLFGASTTDRPARHPYCPPAHLTRSLPQSRPDSHCRRDRRKRTPLRRPTPPPDGRATATYRRKGAAQLM